MNDAQMTSPEDLGVERNEIAHAIIVLAISLNQSTIRKYIIMAGALTTRTNDKIVSSCYEDAYNLRCNNKNDINDNLLSLDFTQDEI